MRKTIWLQCSLLSLALLQAGPVSSSGNKSSGILHTYYVDPAGADSNSGKSPSLAFATVARINRLQQQGNLHCGDAVAFKRSGVWRESLEVTVSGCAGNPIVFEAYGTGPQPQINGSDLATWTQGDGNFVPTNVWYTRRDSDPLFPSFNGAPGIEKSSTSQLTAAHAYYWDGIDMLYVYSPTDPTNIVEIPTRTNVIMGKGFTNITFTQLDIRGAALYGFYCGTAHPCSNLIFESDTFELNYAHGLLILSDYGVIDDSGMIHASIFRNNGGHGIKISGDGPFKNWTVNANQVYGNCLIYDPSDGIHQFCGGIYFDAARTQAGGVNSVIEYNNVHDNGIAGCPMSTGQGIWIDTVDGVSIHHNVVWNSTATGILLEKTLNSLAYNNVVFDSGRTKYTAALSVAGGEGFNSSHNSVFNNTLIGGWWTLANHLEDDNGQSTYNSFANNVSINQNGGQAIYVGRDAMNNGVNSWGNIYTHNGFGVPVGSCYFNYGDTCLSTDIAFEGAVGSTTNDVLGDPLFVDAAAQNFNLQPGSPDSQAGIKITGYTGSTPDVGAF